MKAFIRGLVTFALFLGWVLVCILRVESAYAAPTLEPFVTYTHLSDLMRGPPLFGNTGGHEPTEDYLGAGVTIVWPKAELDLSHGIKSRDCSIRRGCKGESGTLIALRVYPWRK